MFLREDEEMTTTETWTNAQVMKVFTIDWAFSYFLFKGSYLYQHPAPSVGSVSQGFITQELYIPDFFDEEFDQRYDVPGLWNCDLSQLSLRLYIVDLLTIHHAYCPSCVHTPHWYG